LGIFKLRRRLPRRSEIAPAACLAAARRAAIRSARRLGIRTAACDKLGFSFSAPSMPVRVSEAFVLRTYPFQEGDLIVSFFTRDQGRLRGVAKRARRLKSTFGSTRRSRRNS